MNLEERLALINKPPIEEIVYFDLVNKPPIDELYHYGVKGMKWGVRRYQDKNGRFTVEGKKSRSGDAFNKASEKPIYAKE